jgi:hypothetical protein
MVRQQAMHPILGALQGISRPAQGTTSRASLYAQKPQLGGGTQNRANLGGPRPHPIPSPGPVQQLPLPAQTLPAGPIQQEPAGGERHGGRPGGRITPNTPQPQLDPDVAAKLSFDDIMYLTMLSQGNVVPGPSGAYAAPSNFGGGPENFTFEDIMKLTQWYNQILGR